MRSAFPVLALTLTLILLSSVSVQAQPTTVNISTVRPPSHQAGTVMAIQGGPFQPVSGDTGSVVWLPDFNAPLNTHVESSSRLIAMIPTGTHMCGEQQLVVRTYVNLNNQESFFDSNTVVIDIDCPGGTGQQLDRPRVDLLSTINGLNGEKTLRIEGDNLVPNALATEVIFGNAKPTPRTEVRVSNESYDNTFILQSSKYEEGEVELPSNFPCGEYYVELKNYHDGQVSEPSFDQGRSTLRNTLNCQDNTSVLEPNEDEGIFVVDRLELPEKAYVGERFQGSVYIKINDSGPGETTFFAQAQMLLLLDGEERDTRTLNLSDFTNGSAEGRSFPFDFTLETSGSREIEVRIGESYKKKTVNVESRNGNGTPPNEELPPQTGSANLSDYDSNGDCKFNDTEFFNVLDAWLSESITNSTFFSGVDAWLGETNVCSASSSSTTLRTQMNGTSFVFATSGGSPIGTVKIYDMQGQVVFSKSAQGSELVWNLMNDLGQRVANGVYIVRFENVSEIRKLVVMR